jgi:hypothetical protein
VRSLLDRMVYVPLVGSFYLSATANAKTNLFVRACMTAHYAASGLMAKPIRTKNAETIELVSPPLMSWIGNDRRPCDLLPRLP